MRTASEPSVPTKSLLAVLRSRRRRRWVLRGRRRRSEVEASHLLSRAVASGAHNPRVAASVEASMFVALVALLSLSVGTMVPFLLRQARMRRAAEFRRRTTAGLATAPSPNAAVTRQLRVATGG